MCENKIEGSKNNDRRFLTQKSRETINNVCYIHKEASFLCVLVKGT
jgi:hypothetical protein